MYFKQFYLGCLAQASYLIGSEGEAAVVDPQRDVDQYLEEAESQGLKIKYVIETHLHADFVSGHRELAERAGSEIVFGEKACATFPHRAVREGDEIKLGKVVLRFIETPGHTPEGVSVLVIDSEVSDQPQKVLTGDTLFVGDVGRPDLAPDALCNLPVRLDEVRRRAVQRRTAPCCRRPMPALLQLPVVRSARRPRAGRAAAGPAVGAPLCLFQPARG